MLKRASTTTAADQKRFCAIPARFQSSKHSTSEAKKVTCGECKLVGLVQSLRDFAKRGIANHNAKCLQRRTEYIEKGIQSAKLIAAEEHYAEYQEYISIDDIDEADIDMDDILDEYRCYLETNKELHSDLEKLQTFFDEYGIVSDILELMDEEDGMIDQDEVLVEIDSLEYSDWNYADMSDTFKFLEIPRVTHRCSFATGGGIRKHCELTQHDVELGKD